MSIPEIILAIAGAILALGAACAAIPFLFALMTAGAKRVWLDVVSITTGIQAYVYTLSVIYHCKRRGRDWKEWFRLAGRIEDSGHNRAPNARSIHAVNPNGIRFFLTNAVFTKGSACPMCRGSGRVFGAWSAGKPAPIDTRALRRVLDNCREMRRRMEAYRADDSAHPAWWTKESWKQDEEDCRRWLEEIEAGEE